MRFEWVKVLVPACRMLGNKLSEILYPTHVCCDFCGKERVLLDSGLCYTCAASVKYFTDYPLPDNLSAITSAYQYEGSPRNAVLRLKYSGATYLADVFAESISVPRDWNVDCLVPVPLHRGRQRKRGYNQSELIARALSAKLGDLPVSTGYLIRTTRTKTQQGLSASKRKKNLNGAFLANESVKGHRVLLVDDVVTTGATLSACAEALLAKGAAAVFAATVCAVEKNK